MKISRINRISLKISILLILAVELASAFSANSTLEASTQRDDLKSDKPKKSEGSIGGRAGRMLNLDVMAGELGRDEKVAQERLMSGNRQSRMMTESAKTSESGAAASASVEGRSPSKKGGRKMSIKGFIPIVSLDGKHNFEGLADTSESDSDADESAAEKENTNPTAAYQSNLREHLANSYGGQTSLGHASFAPVQNQQHQPAEWQQFNSGSQSVGNEQFVQPDSSRSNRKLLLSSNLAGGLGKRGLISSLIPSTQTFNSAASTLNSNYAHQRFQQPMSQLSGPMNMPPVQAASSFNANVMDPNSGECVCVPFFQCKNGYLSESQLSKSQLSQLTTSGANLHQIPRALSGFKTDNTQEQPNDLYYNANVQPQQQVQQINGQLQGDTQQQQQQQFVNDMIYEQLRKSIESSNLEQQLQQQEAYQQANQQALSLIDERSNSHKQQPSNSSGEVEERSLLNPLASRRQLQSSQKCGIMRTCCRVPPRHVRSPNQLVPTTLVRPHMSGAARFVQSPQLVASPSAMSRPHSQYQMAQTMSIQAQQTQPSIMQEFNNYQQQQQQGQLLASEALSIAQQPVQRPQQGQFKASPSTFMQGRCGQRQTLGISGRVQNADAQQPGAEASAEFGEFPAHAAILKRLSPGDSLFVCSAVLISSQWLATAAHCVRKSRPEELKVRLGEWDVQRDDEFYPHFESNVRELVIHPDFQPSSLINDIALIRIENTVDQQQMPHIAPACLAAELPTALTGESTNFQFAGQRCWVAGWGKDAFGQQGAFQSVLKKVDLPVVGHDECEMALKYQTKLGRHFRLHASNICAGGERGKDACEGDGGAGLYCVDPTSGLSKAVGLVSWGVGCGQRGVPGVYVNLGHFSNWIEQVVAGSGEPNVYYDARANNGLDTQNFRNVISERSNSNVTLVNAQMTTTPQPPAAENSLEERQAPSVAHQAQANTTIPE